MQISSLRRYQRRHGAPRFDDLPPSQCAEAEAHYERLCARWGDNLPQWRRAPDVLLARLSEQTSDTLLGEPIDILAGSARGVRGCTEAAEALAEWLPDLSSDDAPLADLLAADHALMKERWTAYKSRTTEPERTWHGLLAEIGREARPERLGYRVLTVHAAKGLEFRAVSILGMNEGSFPDFRNTSEDDLESEQRLAYVAVTRASRVLRLSRPCYRSTRFGPRFQEESRFIALAGLAR